MPESARVLAELIRRTRPATTWHRALRYLWLRLRRGAVAWDSLRPRRSARSLPAQQAPARVPTTHGLKGGYCAADERAIAARGFRLCSSSAHLFPPRSEGAPGIPLS